MLSWKRRRSAIGALAPGLAVALVLLASGSVTVATQAQTPVPLGRTSDGLDEATQLDREVERLHAEGRYSEATDAAERALAIREQELGPDDVEIARSLSDLATIYSAQNKGEKAEALYRRAVAIYEAKLGPNHPNVAALLNNLAVLYANQGRYADVEPLFLRALAIYEVAHGLEHESVANVLASLGELYRAQGRYADAEPIYLRAIRVSETSLGPENPALANALNSLGSLYRSQGRYADAEPLLVRALAIREKVFGLDHPTVAVSLSSLAALYTAQGATAKAEPLLERALALRERAFGPAHPHVAVSLSDLAALYHNRAEYSKSSRLFLRALRIYEGAVGPDHPVLAVFLNNLAESYRAQGDSARAEPLLERALALREKALGADHPDVASSLVSLGVLYETEGAYGRAEPLFQRALEIYERAFDPNHPSVGQVIDRMAVLDVRRGRYGQAETRYRRAIAIKEQRLGPNHPDLASSLNNLAALYDHIDRFDDAEALYGRALTIYETALGPSHPSVAATLNNLAALHWERRRYADALKLHQRALEIRESAFGPTHAATAESLGNLAAVHERLREFERAEALYLRALAIYETALGPFHPSTGLTCYNLAGLNRARGRLDTAIDFQRRANEIRERDLLRNLTGGSERAKLQYLELSASDLDRTVSLHVQMAPANAAATELAFETIVRRKGRALDVLARQIAALRERATDADRELLDRLGDARAALARETVSGSTPRGSEDGRTQVAELEQRVEALEREVVARSQRLAVEFQIVSLDAVRSKIPENACLVEFARVSRVDPVTGERGAARYVVYVATRSGPIGWADLGDAEPIDTLIFELRGHLRSPDSSVESDVRPAARELDRRIFQPVRGLAGAVRHLLVAPDAALNLVPFAALVDEQGRFLVEEFQIHYLTSGRDLLRLDPRGSRGETTIFADPDFGGGDAAATRDLEAVSDPETSSDAAPAFATIRMRPLPGTADEARALAALMPNARVVTKGDATEDALKAVEAPDILHIATHGFFLGPAEDPARAPSRGRPGAGGWSTLDRASLPGPAIENPLLLSGLGLSGANERRADGKEDGLLTALEVSGLNLWGTQLVVLSACDTGLGIVRAGDGVHGLRRALVLAGAETQMMSLWRVSDRGTRELMVAFYGELLSGTSRAEALRRVQRRMLDDPARSHPFYWASFIQSGAWGALRR